MSTAHDLSPAIWNAISDLVARSQGAREIYFVQCTKVDKTRLLVWAEEFGDISIPCVAHTMQATYYDTLDTGSVQRKTAIITIKPPKTGDLIVVLDPLGAKRFPICLGTIQSKSGFWEGE